MSEAKEADANRDVQPDPERDLIRSIHKNLDNGKVSVARLETDDRVLARITDGIYRQPASALRELIANSYDADAEHVYIQTDAPRFRQLTVRDDGNGMTIESLARLIHHIGGSAKRISEGSAYGVADKRDPSLSPKGRRLIGKIGIGLFAVSQLTRQFQIITKVAGDGHRLVAEVLLKTYTEDELINRAGKGRTKVETGTVRIRAVPATDRQSHGTEIILMNLRPQTRAMLQSRDIWDAIDASVEGEPEPRQPPKYHIGRLNPAKPEQVLLDPSLPWDKGDAPNTRFGKLFQAIIDELAEGEQRPSLEAALDNYLRTLWTLSLSAPVDYIGKHPFSLTGSDEPVAFSLSNAIRGQAVRLHLKPGESLRDRLGLRAPERGRSQVPFSVFVDDVQLLRPVRFSGLPKTSHVIKTPLVFVGKDAPDLSKIPKEDRGGELEFEAYFLWTPKIVPKEHAGLLVRISDASGTLFDETFVKYQVAEITRLRQITAEIFVIRGLDAALNIDRESFNFAHPHFQYLMKWVHRCLRQLANVEKQVASDLNKAKKEGEHESRIQAITAVAADEIALAYAGRDEEPPVVVFAGTASQASEARRVGGALAFDSKVVFANFPSGRNTQGKQNSREQFEERMRAVAQVLNAYGVFDAMKYERQQALLRAIVTIFSSEGGG